MAVAQGESPDALAAAVLDDELVTLALAVAAGGEHRWRRAIELAGALLAIERAGTGGGARDTCAGHRGGSWTALGLRPGELRTQRRKAGAHLGKAFVGEPPYDRTKDLAYLAHVLGHALPHDDERRWDPDPPVFLSGVEHAAQSAFFVGAEVARIVEAPHRAILDRFFARLDAPDEIDFAMMLREDRLTRLLAAFRAGIG